MPETLAPETPQNLDRPAPETPSTDGAVEPQAQPLVSETLVEEVSIDGMCGVY